MKMLLAPGLAAFTQASRFASTAGAGFASGCLDLDACLTNFTGRGRKLVPQNVCPAAPGAWCQDELGQTETLPTRL